MFKKPEGVTQEYIWVAEYYNGFLYEFENEELENSFYDIERERLQRFGLVGKDRMWFECYRGTFNLLGNTYDLIYKWGDRVIPLTGMDMFQRDIITYKKAYAEAEISKKRGTFTNKIVAYYFGYKSEFEIEGIKFNFKPIICKSVGGELYLDLHLVSSENLDGDLYILKNGEVIEKFNAPLVKNMAGGVQWEVR